MLWGTALAGSESDPELEEDEDDARLGGSGLLDCDLFGGSGLLDGALLDGSGLLDGDLTTGDSLLGGSGEREGDFGRSGELTGGGGSGPLSESLEDRCGDCSGEVEDLRDFLRDF